MVSGKGGSEIEKLRLQCEKLINKNKTDKVAVFGNICLLYTSRCV